MRRKVITVALLVSLPILLAGWFQRGFWTKFLKDPGVTWEEYRHTLKWIFFPVEENLRTTRLPIYELRVKPANLRKLEEPFPERSDPRFSYTFIRDVRHDYVRGAFWHGGEKGNVKVRYRGDSFYHWGKRKKSWRVKFKNEELFQSQRRINLVSPKFAGRIDNYLSYLWAGRLGVLTPLSYFVHARLNGSYLGLMLHIEQIDKHFLINRRLPEGKIYYGDDAKPFWHSVDYWQAPGGSFRIQQETPDTEIEEFVRLVNEEPLKTFYPKISQLVDIPAVQRWHAHMNLVGSLHQDAIHNIKLIFDPSRGKFLPVSWDLNFAWLYKNPSVLFAPNLLLARLALVPEYHVAKNRLLWNVLTEEFPLEERLKSFHDTVDLVKEDLRADRLAEWHDGKRRLRRLSFEKWEEGLGWIEKSLKKQDEVLRRDLSLLKLGGGWFRHKQNVRGEKTQILGLVTVDAESISGLALERLTLTGKNLDAVKKYFLVLDQNGNEKLDVTDPVQSIASEEAISSLATLALHLPVHGQIKVNGFRSGDYRGVPRLEKGASRIRFFILATGKNSPVEVRAQELELEFRNLVTDFKTDKITWPVKNETSFASVTHEIVEPVVEDTVIRWSDLVRLRKDFVVPEERQLKIAPGTIVQLDPGVSLIVRGSVLAKGTAKAPIRFQKTHTQGQPWGTVALLLTPPGKKNIFHHCSFSGGSEGAHQFVKFSGMLAAHHAPVELRHIEVRDNHGEDGINLKYSDFSLDHLRTDHIYSDAVDLDYAKGTISHGAFAQSKNDAVDLSYSEIKIQDSRIEGAGDKGISVGERSEVHVERTIIRGNQIGVAVKDESVAHLGRVSFSENGSPFQLYRKKNEFSFGGCIDFAELPALSQGTKITVADRSRIKVKVETIKLEGRPYQEVRDHISQGACEFTTSYYGNGKDAPVNGVGGSRFFPQPGSTSNTWSGKDRSP